MLIFEIILYCVNFTIAIKLRCNSIDAVVHIVLESTLSSGVNCPNGTLYCSEACPQGHTALGYNVRGGHFEGGGSCDTMTLALLQFSVHCSNVPRPCKIENMGVAWGQGYRHW